MSLQYIAYKHNHGFNLNWAIAFWIVFIPKKGQTVLDDVTVFYEMLDVPECFSSFMLLWFLFKTCDANLEWVLWCNKRYVISSSSIETDHVPKK